MIDLPEKLDVMRAMYTAIGEVVKSATEFANLTNKDLMFVMAAVIGQNTIHSVEDVEEAANLFKSHLRNCLILNKLDADGHGTGIFHRGSETLQ